MKSEVSLFTDMFISSSFPTLKPGLVRVMVKVEYCTFIMFSVFSSELFALFVALHTETFLFH